MRIRAAMLAAAVFSCGCSVGPKYHRSTAPVPPAFKESPPPGWKVAAPMEGVLRGRWWEIYGDPQLNALEEQVAISNQNVLLAEAQFREARAAIRVARANLFPTITGGPSITYSVGSTNLGVGQVGGTGTTALGGTRGIFQNYNLLFDLTWQLDIWGSIRHSVRAATDTAQASDALLENARLSFQSTLAEDYFSLRGLDARERLYADTVKEFQEILDLTLFRFRNGVASDADVALAQTQLESARAEWIDLGVQRAQFEHAIAVLTGKPPAELTIPAGIRNAGPPPVPTGVPSHLLERRPDIAAAERQVATANEQIGVAKAAYFPTLTLGGSGGLQSSSITTWLSWPSHFWSIGPQLVGTVLDFGRRRGNLQLSKATYDATVANYRQIVLTAFQQIEDNLAALRILEKEAAAQDLAVRAARRSLDITTFQYKNGTADYLQVLAAQTNLLASQNAAITIATSRMVASVLLVEALGGGWDASQLPTSKDLRSSK